MKPGVFAGVALVIVTVGGFFFLRDEPKPPVVRSQAGERTLSIRMSPEERREAAARDPRSPQNLIVNYWATKDYDQAVEAFRDWLQSDPAAALDFAGAMRRPLRVSHFSPVIKAYLETLSPELAMDHTLRIGNDHRVQESVSADLFADWFSKSPAASIAWLEEHHAAPFVENLAERIGRLGKFGDPEKAFEWMIAVKEEHLRQKLIRGTMLEWLHTKPEEAVGYLNALEDTAPFDDAAYAYAEDILKINPDIAMTWAEGIVNESLRSMILSQIEAHRAGAE